MGQFEKFAKLRAKGRLPWLVVAFHRPMYVDDPDISIGLGNQWVASVLREQLEPLFAKYQVDMTWVSAAAAPAPHWLLLQQAHVCHNHFWDERDCAARLVQRGGVQAYSSHPWVTSHSLHHFVVMTCNA